VRRTAVGAALHGAVFPVPTRDAEASTVLALSVFVAPGIALFQIAEFPGPSRIALAGIGDAVAVIPAVEIAQFWKIGFLAVSVGYASCYLWNSLRLTIWARRCKSGCLDRTFRDRNSREGIVGRPCPFGCSPVPSNPSCRCTNPRRNNRVPNMWDADSRLEKNCEGKILQFRTVPIK
jgi:hypothetical protein